MDHGFVFPDDLRNLPGGHCAVEPDSRIFLQPAQDFRIGFPGVYVDELRHARSLHRPQRVRDLRQLPFPAEAKPAVEQVKDTTAVPDAGEVKTHTVKENEDVVSIAIQYGVSPSAIMDLNDLKNGEALTPGRVLKLPANAKMQ